MLQRVALPENLASHMRSPRAARPTGIRYDNNTIENAHQHRSAGRGRESDLGPDDHRGRAAAVVISVQPTGRNV